MLNVLSEYSFNNYQNHAEDQEFLQEKKTITFIGETY